MPRITAVTVTELTPDTDNPEPWLVEWSGVGGLQRQRHDSKKAAQRHVANMLKELAPGLGRDDVLTINYRNQGNPSPK